MHQSSALFHAEQAMIVTYGRSYASKLHFANPLFLICLDSVLST